MRTLIVHPGTQHSFRLAVELYRLNRLLRLRTGFAIPAGGALDRAYGAAPRSIARRVANRRVSELPRQLVGIRPVYEMIALGGIRSGLDSQHLLHWRNARFQNSVPSRDLANASVVVGFDTSSWILARRCEELGVPQILVQTIGHPDSRRSVIDALLAKYPEWVEDSDARLGLVRRSEQEEHDRATLIVASSSFTRQTLVDNGVAESKIRVISHGVDCHRFSVKPATGSRPFRFIYAGLIDGRKGIPVLLDAWRRLAPHDAELWLVGPATKRQVALLPPLKGLKYLGAVPQYELPDLFGQCDAFVFPSYFEGFGLVILQAMACGLPAITTTATAGPDLFSEGEAGWIVAPGDVERLAAAMEQALSDPGQVAQMGKRAREIAEQSTWQHYGQRWCPVLDEASQVHGSAKPAAAPPTRVLLAHPGTQYSGQLARQLERGASLHQFHTGFAISQDGWAAGCANHLPGRFRSLLKHRLVIGVPPRRLRTQGGLEVASLMARRVGINEQDIFSRRNAAFQRRISDRDIQEADVIVGFDTSSWILCKRAHELGRNFVLDQSIGHPRSFARVAQLLKEEFPGWPSKVPAKTEGEFTREEQEHADADRIVVPSRFVARTLIENGVSADKIRNNPFGVDLEWFKPAESPPPLSPVRFLFVGSSEPRKGLPVLLRTWKSLHRIHDAELWIVGSGEVPGSVRAEMPGNVRVFGRLSHADLHDVLLQCHVFVFPSFFEGLAQVQLEAAACGLPVIGTENSGAEEVVRDGETGFVIPVGNGAALGEAISRFLDDPGLILQMRKRLIEERVRFSWECYGDRWLDILGELSRSRRTSTAVRP